MILHVDPLCMACLLYNEEEDICWQERYKLRCKLTLLNNALILYGCRINGVLPEEEAVEVVGKKEDLRRFARESIQY